MFKKFLPNIVQFICQWTSVVYKQTISTLDIPQAGALDKTSMTSLLRCSHSEERVSELL